MGPVDAESSAKPRWVICSVGGSVVLVLGLLAWLVVGPSAGRPNKPRPNRTASDSSLEEARRTLARDTDHASCRIALQQVNNHINQQGSKWAVALTAEGEKRLEPLKLDEPALAEVKSTTFTPLDATYLEQCFLLHDAARSLEASAPPRGTDGRPFAAPSLARADTAFSWVMRHVRLQQQDAPTIAPPIYVLRRGWGSGLERGLIFLALLRQLNAADDLVGCLIFRAGPDAARRFWACGVQVKGGPDLYLYDPYIGLPLPGPTSQGRATLAQARKNAAVLGQLTVRKDVPYDVSYDKDASDEIQVEYPLSGLAPRIRFLEEEVLPAGQRVGLTYDPVASMDQLRKTIQGMASVQVMPGPGPGADSLGPWPGKDVLQGFLPAEEGGRDTTKPVQRRQQFAGGLAPFKAMPRIFRDPDRFPTNIELGQRIYNSFAAPFLRVLTDSQQPRNLLLRGRHGKAVAELAGEQRQLNEILNQRRVAGDLNKSIDEWVVTILKLYAEKLQARGNPGRVEAVSQEIQKLWDNASAVGLELNAGIARLRIPEVLYLKALGKHDQAEQIQLRIDLLKQSGATPKEADLKQAENAWETAQDAWRSYLEEAAGDGGARAAARMWRGRALLMLGRWQEAAEFWEALSPPMTGPEKVGRLFLAQQVRKAHEKE